MAAGNMGIEAEAEVFGFSILIVRMSTGWVASYFNGLGRQ